MGAAAHVGVLVVVVDAYRLVVPVDVLLEDAELVRLVPLLEDLVGPVPVHDFLPHLVVGLGKLVHALVEGLEILGGELVVDVDVIVEAIVDHRADGHLGLRPELL